MNTLTKVDFKELIAQFINLYGQNFIWFIIIFISFFFLLWIIYLFIRNKGWITTPLEKSLKKQEENTERNTEMLCSINELLTNLIVTQKSNLTDSQIQIIIYDKFVIYKKYFLKEILEIYIRNHIDNKTATLQKIKDNLGAIVREEDDTFFKLPGVDSIVLPPDLKLKSMEQDGLYHKLYNIMIEEDSEKEVARRSKNLLDNFITINWKIR
jgi:hypothetical protein